MSYATTNMRRFLHARSTIVDGKGNPTDSLAFSSVEFPESPLGPKELPAMPHRNRAGRRHFSHPQTGKRYNIIDPNSHSRTLSARFAKVRYAKQLHTKARAAVASQESLVES